MKWFTMTWNGNLINVIRQKDTGNWPEAWNEAIGDWESRPDLMDEVSGISGAAGVVEVSEDQAMAAIGSSVGE